ncbi:AAA family ATPase [Microbacterium schleiferi]|uniref:AAA family ATPase n=1 Tax=Microbacterium schleiferi TaxID=69362 RepID=A0A7S8MUS0_9MICO|nr:AAA family ATPase [Microbacterium schleiferi]QPE03554.1 AAA family ATPase [Microbacterium schleiferi]
MLTTLAIDGYRSIRSLVVPLAPLTVVTGANGSGKSSLYRSLRLLGAAARDGAIRALAAEGGFPGTLWAGPESGAPASGPAQATVRRGPVALRLGFGADAGSFGYAMDLGIPIPSATMFGADPEIKAEAVWGGPVLRSGSLVCERRGAIHRVRTDDGWLTVQRPLAAWESMLAAFGDPGAAPEVVELRSRLRDWRFYDAVRTDADAPARRPAIGTRTPILASDGGDLASALQTIREQGDPNALDAAIERALPGSGLVITDHGGRFELSLRQAGMLRPLTAPELSDGTLRYLVWVAALMSTRPASLIAVNEPETSLHPSLMEPLAAMLGDAATRSQVIVVSHSDALVGALERAGATVHTLEKRNGETRVKGQGVLDAPSWVWPSR